MNPDHSDSPSDRALDELLASRSVEASAEFTSHTLSRIHSEANDEDAEKALDACFARRPVGSSPDFVWETVSRINAESARHDSIIIFPRLAIWFSAAAALVLVGFLGYHLWQKGAVYDLQEGSGTTLVKNSATPALPPKNPTVLGDPAEEGLPDIAMEELFLLADAFEDAEFLLEDQGLDTLHFLDIL